MDKECVGAERHAMPDGPNIDAPHPLEETRSMPKRTPPKKRQSDFRLPLGVSMQQEPIPAGSAYVFRHAELGLLGRLVLQSLPSGYCQILCEVAGDPADPMTAKRWQVLEPV